jgi:transposase-like protein
MAENQTQAQKKKRKKQLSIVEHVQEETAVQNAKEVTKALDELEKQGHQVDIQVCPRCKSPKVERAKSIGGDMWAHIGMLPPSYECTECGWARTHSSKSYQQKAKRTGS